MNAVRTRIFQSWFRFSRSLTLGVRGIVQDGEGRVLLVRHTYTPGLYLPGGGVEKGETAYDALARELVEEAGVTLEAAPDLVGVFSNHDVLPNDHVLLFKAPAWTQAAATSQGEIEELVWADPAAPPQDSTPGTQRRLIELASGASAPALW